MGDEGRERCLGAIGLNGEATDEGGAGACVGVGTGVGIGVGASVCSPFRMGTALKSSDRLARVVRAGGGATAGLDGYLPRKAQHPCSRASPDSPGSSHVRSQPLSSGSKVASPLGAAASSASSQRRSTSSDEPSQARVSLWWRRFSHFSCWSFASGAAWESPSSQRRSTSWAGRTPGSGLDAESSQAYARSAHGNSSSDSKVANSCSSSSSPSSQRRSMSALPCSNRLAPLPPSVQRRSATAPPEPSAEQESGPQSTGGRG
mmetsp:Transcript_29670/g.57041  ORF Transcript_29670/g.57041 Transcript_29670/m.57041 type:complete len:261 (+) Transcript_29670:617-1399(+)